MDTSRNWRKCYKKENKETVEIELGRYDIYKE